MVIIRRPVASLVALVLASACGTTVAVSDQVGMPAPGQADGLGLPAGTVAPGVVAPGPPSSSGAGPSGGTVGPPVESTTAPGAQGSQPAVRASMPVSGRGYDRTSIYLGFPTNNDVNQAAGTGLGAADFGDQPAQIRAITDDINKRGGVLGRKVVPVFHDIRTAQLQTDPTTAAQTTCTAFTQDRTVLAVVNIVAGIDGQTFYKCLAQKQTPLISAGFVPADDPFFAGFAPYLTKLTAASFTHLTPVWLARLQALGYYSGWDTARGAAGTAAAKVGLLYPAAQPQQRIFADVKRRLASQGHPVVKEFQYDVSSLNNESASMASAVLQFRNAGVTHVLSSESDVLLFMAAADSQVYRPRYALTSYHAAAAQLQGFAPSTQLAGSMGVGWLPVSDVDAAHAPPAQAGEKSCRAVMRNASQDITVATAALVAFALCDGIRLITSAFATAQDASGAALRAAMPTGFASALTWRSGLSRSRADMPGVVRDLAYVGGAYRYLSGVERPLS